VLAGVASDMQRVVRMKMKWNPVIGPARLCLKEGKMGGRPPLYFSAP